MEEAILLLLFPPMLAAGSPVVSRGGGVKLEIDPERGGMSSAM
jgi:hypothetical protein